jgi:hypothetical protein
MDTARRFVQENALKIRRLPALACRETGNGRRFVINLTVLVCLGNNPLCRDSRAGYAGKHPGQGRARRKPETFWRLSKSV